MRRVRFVAALRRSAFVERSEPAMSHQDMEMQFADPDWQPASAWPGRSPVEQALAVPVEIKPAPAPNPQADEQLARGLWTPVPGPVPPRAVQPTGDDDR